MEFIVYTDGGCHGNRRDDGCPGGFGFIVLDPGGNQIIKGGGNKHNTTNNRMEMAAVIRSLSSLKLHLDGFHTHSSKHDVIVKTDSRYVCDNFSDYLPEWKKNGWRKSKGGAVLNKDLWKRIDELTPEFKSFRFQWVKGHSKDKFNNLVDEIAQKHIAELKLQPQT